MRVLEINSILKEEGCIYYFNRYTGNAVVEIMAKQVSFPLSFSIEVNPLGIKTIEVDKIPNDIEYPVVPLTKSLKDYISTMDKQGILPQT